MVGTFTEVRSDGQLKRKFSQWKVTKYQRGEAWQYIAHYLKARSKWGKATSVYFGDELIDERRLRKEIARHTTVSYMSFPLSITNPYPKL